MITLVRPDAAYQRSWLECAADFRDSRRNGSGSEDRPLDTLRDPETFRRFVAGLVADALPETPRKPGYVPCTYLWIADGRTIVGSLAIRHELNDFLRREGGHIGYSVRPSARRRGHAAEALKKALAIARELAVPSVLLTCDEDNAASRATIEKNGGVFEGTGHGKRRYWIPTGCDQNPGRSSGTSASITTGFSMVDGTV